MKKLLIPLLCVTLLTGCTLDLHGEDVAKEPESSQPENNNQPSTNNNQSSENENNDKPGNENDDTVIPGPTPVTPVDNGDENKQNTDGTYTRTIVFDNQAPAGELNNDTAKNRFLDFLNGETDLFKSIIVSDHINVNYIEIKKQKEVVSKNLYMWLGSASENGTLQLDFNYDVNYIKVNVEAYSKPYYDTWTTPGTDTLIYNAESEAKFYINSETNVIDLSLSDNEIPQKVEKHEEYSSPIKSLTLGSLDGRVFLHSLEIGYTK